MGARSTPVASGMLDGAAEQVKIVTPLGLFRSSCFRR